MKKTKIICTIGPACTDRDILKKMVLAGMNVARLNFSHGSYEEHEERINLVKEVREELGMSVGLLLDTKGPEFRIKTFKDGKVNIEEGQRFTLTSRDVEGTNEIVSVACPIIMGQFKEGDKIYLNDGLLEFEVESFTDTDIVCRALNSGTVSNRKSMSFPGKVIDQEYLSEQDKRDILFGISKDINFVAASFVSTGEDVKSLREFLNANGGQDIAIIAKIENRSGVDNIDEIVAYCEGVMVARGDLGIEIPYDELPAVQKKIIRKCRLAGKIVVTATEMLESMTVNPRPTRAEISDVANAVYDGTSAVMLSGETAVGKYPVETVMAMSRIAEKTEENIDYKKRFRNTELKMMNSSDAMSHAVCSLAIDVDTKAIVVCTKSGATARMVSRYRCPKPIIGLTPDKKAYHKLALSWGVMPEMCEEFRSMDVLLYHAVNCAKKIGVAKPGDHIVITAGTTIGKSGCTDLIKYEMVY